MTAVSFATRFRTIAADGADRHAVRFVEPGRGVTTTLAHRVTFAIANQPTFLDCVLGQLVEERDG